MSVITTGRFLFFSIIGIFDTTGLLPEIKPPSFRFSSRQTGMTVFMLHHATSWSFSFVLLMFRIVKKVHDVFFVANLIPLVTKYPPCPLPLFSYSYECVNKGIRAQVGGTDCVTKGIRFFGCGNAAMGYCNRRKSVL